MLANASLLRTTSTTTTTTTPLKKTKTPTPQSSAVSSTRSSSVVNGSVGRRRRVARKEEFDLTVHDLATLKLTPVHSETHPGRGARGLHAVHPDQTQLATPSVVSHHQPVRSRTEDDDDDDNDDRPRLHGAAAAGGGPQRQGFRGGGPCLGSGLGGPTTSSRRRQSRPSSFIYLPDITEFVGEDKVSTFRKDGIFSHLACYLGGLFGLAAEHVKRIKPSRMMTLAKGVTETCYRSYNSTATGIGPETFRITGTSPLAIQPYHSYYILRPEYVESLFYLWRLTHDEVYRERGWEVVQALERNCKADGGGYHSLNSVAYKSPDDRMESFFLAETLKYLYLLYTYDGVVPLEDFVFNTEAHALSKRGHGRREKTADLPKVPTTAADFWPMVVGKSRDDWGSGPAPLDIQE